MRSGAELGRMDDGWKRSACVAVEAGAAVLVATAVSDALGYVGASFYLLVAGVPVLAVAGLMCFGRAVDAEERGAPDRTARVQSTLLGLLIVAVVLGAAARSPAIGDGSVPVAATVALALGLFFLALQAVIALAPLRRSPADR